MYAVYGGRKIWAGTHSVYGAVVYDERQQSCTPPEKVRLFVESTGLFVTLKKEEARQALASQAASPLLQRALDAYFSRLENDALSDAYADYGPD